MRPTTPTTKAERRVIRWVFGSLAIAALLFLALTWHGRTRDCEAACRAKGATSGELKFNRGSRLNLGSYCACAGPAAPPPVR